MRELVIGVVGLVMACGGGTNDPVAIDAAPDAAPDASMLSTTTLTIIPMDLDFGSVTVGSTLAVTITNGTPGAVSITSIRAGGDEYTVSPDNCLSPPLRSGASCFVPITTAQFGSSTSFIEVDSTAGDVFGQVEARASGLVTVDVVGSGTVIASPGIDCGQICSNLFGTSPLLMATPAANNTFVMWSDPTCGANPTCRILAPATITATFAATPSGTP